MKLTPKVWPPVTNVPKIRWSAIRPQPWPLMCLRTTREGLIMRQGMVIPVVIKGFTPTRERYVLADLKQVPGVPELIGMAREHPRAMILARY